MRLDRKLIVVSGKGGVGKTTVAASLAYAFAASGKRTLLARADPHDRAWHLFGIEPPTNSDFFGDAIPNLDIVDIRPENALREYGAMVLRSKHLYAAVFENRLAASFLRGTPGVYAWATLGKACFHANPQAVSLVRQDAQVDYDRVIFDAPATGHLLDMVRVPIVIRNTATGGLLRRGADAALDVLSDPRTTAWVVTSTAETFSLREAVDLRAALVAEFASQEPIAVLNQAEAETLHGSLLSLAAQLPAASATIDYALLVRRVVHRQQEQRAALLWLREAFGTVLRLPYLVSPVVASTLAESLNNGEHSGRERGPT